ncbi:amino acid ABC transporter substrate-binding protein [Sphingomonadaceae bacterium OTU29THOMA1]|nr:amino acid ABC transporter substrate-binding protein [Sphingomonadaceae bacterium OTU29THOMA1]
MRAAALILASAILASSCAPASDNGANNIGRGTTLVAVKARGFVRCGANKDVIGFGAPDSNGYWRGLDVDVCRAVAAAVLGDQDKVRFFPLSGQNRLIALQTGEIDVLPRTTTWTLLRDANGVNFTFPTYYDRTSFMVRKESGVTGVAGLAGATVCVQAGSTNEEIFTDVSRRRHLNLRAVVFDNLLSTRQAFIAGRCDAIISDGSALASTRATQAARPDDLILFPADDRVTPLTPAVRHGDDQWFDIVKFSIDALFTAEQLGVTITNAEQMRASNDPAIKRFLGVEPSNGRALGLPDDYAFQIVHQVGNYAQVYDRNLGAGSALKIPRGLNRLQRDGGLIVPIGVQ